MDLAVRVHADVGAVPRGRGCAPGSGGWVGGGWPAWAHDTPAGASLDWPPSTCCRPCAPLQMPCRHPPVRAPLQCRPPLRYHPPMRASRRSWMNMEIMVVSSSSTSTYLPGGVLDWDGALGCIGLCVGLGLEARGCALGRPSRAGAPSSASAGRARGRLQDGRTVAGRPTLAPHAAARCRHRALTR